jgi:hypothetical protein
MQCYKVGGGGWGWGGRRSRSQRSLGVDRPGSLVERNLSGVRVIMVIVRVPVGEMLCQGVMRWIQYSSACCHTRVGTCSYVLSF